VKNDSPITSGRIRSGGAGRDDRLASKRSELDAPRRARLVDPKDVCTNRRRELAADCLDQCFLQRPYVEEALAPRAAVETFERSRFFGREEALGDARDVDLSIRVFDVDADDVRRHRAADAPARVRQAERRQWPRPPDQKRLAGRRLVEPPVAW